MDTKDALGDRMKFYERAGACTDKFLPFIPVVARLDGRAFSSFTRGLKKPYDEQMSKLMQATTAFLVGSTNARIGYTQSDEITLVFLKERVDADLLFDGRRDKMVSILAARATKFFTRHLGEYLPAKQDEFKENDENAPEFDARVFQVPSKFEAVNCLLWREQDATKNSIAGAAQANFKHGELQGKNTSDMQEMLFSQRGINWNDYPDFFKRGSYYRRQVKVTQFTAEEIDQLPPKHAARKNPNLTVERREIVRVDMPPLIRVVNREAVIFDGEEPQTLQQD